MPKKAVATFFLLAFIGATIYVYITFPRTKDEIPKSNNQRPFPTEPAPAPEPQNPPIPETVPHPDTPKVPPGPTLRIMAWASSDEAKVLTAEADQFAHDTGRQTSLQIDDDADTYHRDLTAALASNEPPDVLLVSARDFSGVDPTQDLADVDPLPGSAPRSIAAFTVGSSVKAVPDEFSADVLFYNPAYFDQACIAYPGPHWTWDILEADARAMGSLKIKDPSGQAIFPLELPADFDFWNILCTATGHPALDLGVWHLAGGTDNDTRESQLRALDLIQEIFTTLSVTAPPPKVSEPAGRLFAAQRAALLIAPSSLAVRLPAFRFAFTLLPRDLYNASLAQVNGWAVTAASKQGDAAHILAAYLAWQPVHAGWSGVKKPDDDDSPAGICYAALNQAVLPRVEPKTAPFAQYLDQQINQLARDGKQKTDALYARIQTQYSATTGVSLAAPNASAGPKTDAGAGAQLRGL